MSKISLAVRNLLAGTALASPPEDAEAPEASADAGAKGPTAESIQALVDKSADDATAAANTRWNTVMSSDAGVANPKAAASLLMMAGAKATADEVIASLGTLNAPAATGATGATNAQRDQRERQAADDRARLEGDPNTRVDTGAAASGPDQNRGEGDGKKATRSQARTERAKKLNAAALKQGGVPANADA